MSAQRQRSRAPAKALRRKADQLFSAIVRARGACESCGRTERLQCAHIVPRRYLSVRWIEENALCLCSACHVYYTHFPLEFEAFVLARIGEEPYGQLKREAMQGHGPPPYREIIDRLEERAKEVRGEG